MTFTVRKETCPPIALDSHRISQDKFGIYLGKNICILKENIIIAKITTINRK